jgi:aspartate/methionine/tyrosine aminotransferase
MDRIEEFWRSKITEVCGGADFDAPGGGYSFSAILAEERELEKRNKPGETKSALLKLSIADPTWKMPLKAMKEAMRYYEKCPDATRYTDNAGVRDWNLFDDTNVAIATYLNRFEGSGVIFDKNWVRYSPGAIKRALAEYVPTTLFDDMTQLIFPTPGYPVIKSPMNIRGAEFVDSPMVLKDGRWHFNLDHIKSEIRPGFRKNILYLNVPHNPTGRGFTRSEWEVVLEWARGLGLILIVDEAYIDICYVPGIVSVLNVPRWEESCIVLQSVSKGYSATGLRFGWIVANPTMIKVIDKAMDVKDSGLFGPSIVAGLTCLNNHSVWTHETRMDYQKLHTLLYGGLSEAGFKSSWPDAGLCQLTPAPISADGQKFGDAIECAQWVREKLRISLMNYTVEGRPYLRWAVTIKPIPECNLPSEEFVIREVVRRLRQVKFEF